MAIRLTRIYTRRGDQGETDLVGGARVRKDSPRIDAYGTVDELNATIGVARAVNAKKRSAPCHALGWHAFAAFQPFCRGFRC